MKVGSFDIYSTLLKINLEMHVRRISKSASIIWLNQFRAPFIARSNDTHLRDLIEEVSQKTFNDFQCNIKPTEL